MSFDLVTGATGFIGRHLAGRLLAEGRRVRVLCRASSVGKLDARIQSGAELIRGDLRDKEAIRAGVVGAERVFHCAGHVSDWGTREEFYGTNVEATERLLEASLASGVGRFLHLSSIAVFGVPSPTYFDDRSAYRQGKDFYSQTKIEAEKRVLSYATEKRLRTTVLRPAVVYGPHGTWAEEPLRMIRKNKMFLLGGGKGTCHPCYIENLIDATLLAASHPSALGQAFIVADDEPISFREYFDHLARIAGQGPIKRSIPLPVARVMASGFETVARASGSRSRPLLTHAAIDMVCTSSRLSMEKIRRELGFRPRFGVESAMRALEAWYREQGLPA